jgi:hypothetical protein
MNVLAAEQFTEYEQNLKEEGEALKLIDAEMDSFARQASSLRTRQKVAQVLEFILSLRGRRGRFRSPRARPRAGGAGIKPRAKFRRPRGRRSPGVPGGAGSGAGAVARLPRSPR